MMRVDFCWKPSIDATTATNDGRNVTDFIEGQYSSNGMQFRLLISFVYQMGGQLGLTTKKKDLPSLCDAYGMVN